MSGTQIVNEFQLGERLRLDLYLPAYKLGIEYHGRQHFYFSDLFYETAEDFKAAQARDERKIELCKERGIALVVFTFRDKLTPELVFERVMAAIETTPVVKEQKQSRYKGNEYYESRKEAHRERRKQQYKEAKRKRDNR